MSNHGYDVVVIGGGPGGARAATTRAEGGERPAAGKGELLAAPHRRVSPPDPRLRSSLQRRKRNDVFVRSRRIPILRERLIVLLSGGHDGVDRAPLLSGAER